MLEKLSHSLLARILDTIPVDMTFVDDVDRVRYFNREGKRIFARPRSVIGRKVQDCHPQKSLHRVQQILDEFRAGDRDVAEFWVDSRGRKVYIRYFPVRDDSGAYFGCLEVTQDITDIQKIQGEKRLL